MQSIEFLLVTLAGLALFALFFPGISEAKQKIFLYAETKKALGFAEKIRHYSFLLETAANNSSIELQENPLLDWIIEFKNKKVIIYVSNGFQTKKIEKSTGKIENKKLKIKKKFILKLSKQNNKIKTLLLFKGE